MFLQSVGQSSYAVIRNKKRTFVGQLVGDGVRVVFRNGAATGTYHLCLRRDPSIGISRTFKVPDFATIDESLDVNSITPVDAIITTEINAAGDTLMCTDIAISAQPQTYLPIFRVKDWSNALLLDTLTTTQRNCFFAAFAFYLAVWLLITYRALNVVLYLIIIRQRRRGTVRMRLSNLLVCVLLTTFPSQNMILLGLVLLFLFMSTTLRWVYFIITPFGVLVDKPRLADLLMAEFPFYFWLTIFTILVAWYASKIFFICLAAHLRKVD